MKYILILIDMDDYEPIIYGHETLTVLDTEKNVDEYMQKMKDIKTNFVNRFEKIRKQRADKIEILFPGFQKHDYLSWAKGCEDALDRDLRVKTGTSPKEKLDFTGLDLPTMTKEESINMRDVIVVEYNN